MVAGSGGHGRTDLVLGGVHHEGAVVRDPDGAVRSPGAAINPEWHASMRYLRMSEITDDPYDAFRNVYLAL